MKKTFVTIALLAVVGLAGISIADDRWGGGPGRGYCNGPQGQQDLQVEDPAFAQFLEDTAELRNEMFELRQEYFSAMNEEPVDKEYAAELWSRMFDIKAALQEKAEAAGIDLPFGGKGRNFRGGCNGSQPCANSGQPCDINNQPCQLNNQPCANGKQPCGGSGGVNCWQNQPENAPQQ